MLNSIRLPMRHPKGRWVVAAIGSALLALAPHGSDGVWGQSPSGARVGPRGATSRSPNAVPAQSHSAYRTRGVPTRSGTAASRAARSASRVYADPPADAGHPDASGSAAHEPAPTPHAAPRATAREAPRGVHREPIPAPGAEPEMLFEGDVEGEPWMGGYGSDPRFIEDGACGYGCSGPCGHYGGCFLPCPSLCLQNLEMFVGSHGFTGPANRGETASFGFSEGANWGAPVPWIGLGELGMQFGFRTAQSNLSGASSTDEQRHQTFVTGGLFRRCDWGFQGGLVVDYLHETWYFDADLIQLRGELSWLYPCRHEIGFWFSTSTQRESIVSTLDMSNQRTTANEVLSPTDLYAFFYRHRLDDCGSANGRFYAGFTGKGDGLIGADLQTPFNDCWAIQSGFTYLIPQESRGDDGHVEESWNFAISVAWRPRGGFLSQNYYRPLFNVADNGTFMVDRD